MVKEKSIYDLKLIEFVQKYPQLYDKRHGDYKLQHKKVAIWDLAASECGFEGSFILFYFILSSLFPFLLC